MSLSTPSNISHQNCRPREVVLNMFSKKLVSICLCTAQSIYTTFIRCLASNWPRMAEVIHKRSHLMSTLSSYYVRTDSTVNLEGRMILFIKGARVCHPKEACALHAIHKVKRLERERFPNTLSMPSSRLRASHRNDQHVGHMVLCSASLKITYFNLSS